MKTGIVSCLSCVWLACAAAAIEAQEEQRPRFAPVELLQLEPDDAPPPAIEVFEPPAYDARVFVPPGSAPLPPGRRGEGVDRARLTLADGSQIIGEIPADAKVTLHTRIGDGKLALSEATRIDGIGEQGKFRVTLECGDRFTGEIDFDVLKLKTNVGEVPLARKDFVSLETGKVYEEEVAEHRTSRDGRTSTTTYRRRLMFEPSLTPDEIPHSNRTNTYATGAVYAPTTTYIVPAAPGVPVPAN